MMNICSFVREGRAQGHLFRKAMAWRVNWNSTFSLVGKSSTCQIDLRPSLYLDLKEFVVDPLAMETV